MRAFDIREMKASDVKECVPFFIEEYAAYGEKWSAASAQKYLTEKFSSSNKSFCAVAGGEIVGLAIASSFTWWDGKRVFLEEIVVRKEFQHKGIGTELFKMVEKYASEHGASGINTITFRNSKAMRFHEGNGFGGTRLDYIEKKLKR